MTGFFQKYTLYRHSTQHLLNMLYHFVFCVTIIIICFHIYIYYSQYLCVLSLKILPMPYFLHPIHKYATFLKVPRFMYGKIYATMSVLFALKIYILHVAVLNMIVFKCSYSNCDFWPMLTQRITLQPNTRKFHIIFRRILMEIFFSLFLLLD